MTIHTSLLNKFETSPAGRRAGTLLANHKTSLPGMLSNILNVIQDGVPGMIPEKRYTAAQLCGQTIWNAWPFKGQKCAAGMCLLFLVKAGALTLELHITKSGKGSKRYYVPAQE